VGQDGERKRGYGEHGHIIKRRHAMEKKRVYGWVRVVGKGKGDSKIDIVTIDGEVIKNQDPLLTTVRVLNVESDFREFEVDA